MSLDRNQPALVRDDEREVGERLGGRHGVHRGSPAAAQEPERLAQLERRLVEGDGAHVREEDHDPGRPEPRTQPRRQPAGQQAGQPGRGSGPAAQGDGGAPAAGHVPAVSTLVAPRVHPGVQGQLPGPERRLQPQHDGQRVLRRGRRVLPGARRHAHRRAAGWRGRPERCGVQERQRQRRQLGLLPRRHLRRLRAHGVLLPRPPADAALSLPGQAAASEPEIYQQSLLFIVSCQGQPRSSLAEDGEELPNVFQKLLGLVCWLASC